MEYLKKLIVNGISALWFLIMAFFTKSENENFVACLMGLLAMYYACKFAYLITNKD